MLAEGCHSLLPPLRISSSSGRENWFQVMNIATEMLINVFHGIRPPGSVPSAPAWPCSARRIKKWYQKSDFWSGPALVKVGIRLEFASSRPISSSSGREICFQVMHIATELLLDVFHGIQPPRSVSSAPARRCSARRVLKELKIASDNGFTILDLYSAIGI